MNILKGKITKIETSGSLSLVEIKVGEVFFKTILIETPETASYLKENNKILVLFKETEVVIGKGITHQISLQNKLEGSILEIESDVLLSKLTIGTRVGNIKAIITTTAVEQLQLKVGEKVMAMVKTNEIMVSE